jgi:hypothetical protein
MLAAHRGELEALGFTLNPNARGQITDLGLPGGYSLDPIYGAGAGVNRKQWLINPPAGAGTRRRAGGTPALRRAVGAVPRWRQYGAVAQLLRFVRVGG